jgi:hypothetical protein
MVHQKRQDLNSLVELSGPPESWGELIAVILGKIPSSGLRFASGERSTRALESRTPCYDQSLDRAFDDGHIQTFWN